MLFYTALLFVATILSWISWKTKIRFIYMLPIAFLYIISTFRNNIIGADHSSYIAAFRSIRHGYTFGTFERGFYYLLKVIGMYTDEFIVVTIIVNLIMFILVYKFVKDNSCIYWISIFLCIANPYLYIQSTFNILRQGIAMSIVAISLSFLKRDKNIEFLMLILIASTFHKSALIGVIFILLKKVEFSTVKILFLECIFAGINLLGISSKLLSLIPRSTNDFMRRESSMFNFGLFKIFLIIYIGILAWNYRKLFKNKNEELFVKIHIIGLMILFLVMSNDIVYRIQIYFELISIVSIPVIIKNFPFKIKFKEKKISFMLIPYLAYYLTMYMLFLIRVSKNVKYIPFKFYT